MPENAARPGFRGTMCGDQVYGNLEAYRWDLSELGFVVRLVLKVQPMRAPARCEEQLPLPA